MTARANSLIKRAKLSDRLASPRSSHPASGARVFVDALERLGYSMDTLLADAGIRRAELNDPDGRIPVAAWAPMFRRALEERPMKNAGMRVATATPFGAFPLIDYLVATSQSVGEGLTRLTRYLRLAEPRSVPRLCEDEEPIRVLLEGHDTPFSAEFIVTLNLLHWREETEGRFRAAYASFCHVPDDVEEMERVLGFPLRRRDRALSSLLERQADEAISRLPVTEAVVLDVRRALASRIGRGDIRIETIARTLATSVRSLQRRLAAAGISYQELLDLARKDAAERCLTNSSLSVGAVAYLLGYSEPAAFNRAFRRWHKETPLAFRARRRSDHSAPAGQPRMPTP
jgi:AraC-like DNA-binding protein